MCLYIYYMWVFHFWQVHASAVDERLPFCIVPTPRLLNQLKLQRTTIHTAGKVQQQQLQKHLYTTTHRHTNRGVCPSRSKIMGQSVNINYNTTNDCDNSATKQQEQKTITMCAWVQLTDNNSNINTSTNASCDSVQGIRNIKKSQKRSRKRGLQVKGSMQSRKVNRHNATICAKDNSQRDIINKYNNNQ